MVPGLTPQESSESEDNRGLSQSERACGVAKDVLDWDVVVILGNRRAFGGKGRNLRKRVWLGLGEEKRKSRETAVRNRSGRVVIGLAGPKLDFVLFWALFNDSGVFDMLLRVVSMYKEDALQGMINDLAHFEEQK